MPSRIELLTARYEADQQRSSSDPKSSLVVRRLTSAVASIGWRAASDTPAELVANRLADVIEACVTGHRNWDTLRVDVAECLRQHADHLDGSSTSRSEWEPAALQVIELYSSGQARVDER